MQENKEFQCVTLTYEIGSMLVKEQSDYIAVLQGKLCPQHNSELWGRLSFLFRALMWWNGSSEEIKREKGIASAQDEEKQYNEEELERSLEKSINIT